MIRFRTVAAVLRPALVAAALVTSLGPLGGCADESQPEYWVKKLDDPVQRPAAIKRLTQFFEDGMTKSNNDRDTPEMKALLAKIVGPMTNAYVTADLDEKTRVDLLKALANTRDPAAQPAILKATTDFSTGKDTAEELKQAAGYIKQLKVKEAAGPLIDAFFKVKPSDPKLGPPYLAVHDAMITLADPSWTQRLIDQLGKPINLKDGQEARNEIYWETTAAEVLGEMRAQEAGKALLKITLWPDKKDIGATAVVALVKIGKGAMLPALEVMSGKDADTVNWAKTQTPQQPTQYLATTAVILGTIGRAEATPVLIDGINRADNDTNRAILARELSKLPATPDSIKAFEAAYEKLPYTGELPGSGQNPKTALAEASASFMDPSLVPWLIKQVKDAKGDEKDNIQSALLASAMKLMKTDQVDDVKKIVDAEGDKTLDVPNMKLAADVMAGCKDQVGCYLGKLDDPASQERNGQFTGIKAAYMLGILGNDDTKAQIAAHLPKIKNDAIRFTALLAIDHLSPKGDVKTADALQAQVDDNAKRGVGPGPLSQIIPRLRARATP